MQALSSKLHIATRTIAATPSITSQGPEVSEKEVVPAKMPISASWFQPELEKEVVSTSTATDRRVDLTLTIFDIYCTAANVLLEFQYYANTVTGTTPARPLLLF